MEKETIALVHSRTFWAAALTLAAVTARTFHLDALTAFAADPHSVDTVLGFVAMLGSVAAIAFRAQATAAVTGIVTPAKK